MHTFGRVTREDADSVSRLYEEYLNGGGDIAQWLDSGLRMPGYCGVKCVEGGQLVGIVSARPGVEFTCGHHGLVREIEARWSGHKLYTADMGLVVPSHRGRGIAKTLMGLARDALLELGCSHIVAELWLRGAPGGSREHSSPILPIVRECWGELIEVGEFPDFYRELKEYGMTCPYCGAGDCVCGAAVYVAELGRGQNKFAGRNAL
jgi:GNAT superfamily N-acetyltransferase